MSDGYKPLTITFVAEVPTTEMDVTIINALTGYIQKNSEGKEAVLRACKFILEKYGGEKP